MFIEGAKVRAGAGRGKHNLKRHKHKHNRGEKSNTSWNTIREPRMSCAWLHYLAIPSSRTSKNCKIFLNKQPCSTSSGCLASFWLETKREEGGCVYISGDLTWILYLYCSTLIGNRAPRYHRDTNGQARIQWHVNFLFHIYRMLNGNIVTGLVVGKVYYPTYPSWRVSWGLPWVE